MDWDLLPSGATSINNNEHALDMTVVIYLKFEHHRSSFNEIELLS